MLNTKLTKPAHAGQEWDWAITNGKLFRIHTPDGNTRFDVLLLGQADYVAINLNDKSEYDPKGKYRLFSINGEFRMWVEEGMKGPIRGVRWEIRYDDYKDEHHTPHWNIMGDSLAPLALERIMGELVNSKGEVV